MPNLLPDSNKKRIKEEYILRLSVVILLFSLTAFILASFLLLPSYFLSKNKAALASERIVFLKSYVEKTQSSGLTEEILFTNEEIKQLSVPDTVKISQSIDAILEQQTDSIKITGIVLRAISDQERSLFLGGIASNRDRLIEFSRSLESVGEFLEVNLPISNLAKNRDIDFNIELKISSNTE